jgi:hypothetical protein
MTDDRSRLTETLLRTHWADECRIAGNALVGDVLAGDVEFEPAPGGLRLEASQGLTILVQALTAIKLCLDLYGIVRDRLRRAPEVKELRETLESHPDWTRVPVERRERLLDDLCGRAGTPS